MWGVPDHILIPVDGPFWRAIVIGCKNDKWRRGFIDRLRVPVVSYMFDGTVKTCGDPDCLKLLAQSRFVGRGLLRGAWLLKQGRRGRRFSHNFIHDITILHHLGASASWNRKTLPENTQETAISFKKVCGFAHFFFVLKQISPLVFWKCLHSKFKWNVQKANMGAHERLCEV